MADLTEAQASQSVKIVGSNSSGVEDNWLEVTSTGHVPTNLNDGSGNAISVGQGLMAASLPVTLSSNQTGINTFLDKSGSGTISALNATITETVNGCSTTYFQVTGTFSLVLSPEGTADGTNWTAISIVQVQYASFVISSLNSPGLFRIDCGGFQQVRLRCSSYTSGTATVSWNAGSGEPPAPFPYDENYGAVGANTLRSAAQIGNATGAADFNFGTVGAQTLRTAAEIGNATGAADFNFGTVGGQTLRTAAQIGNSTGAALFGSGTTSAQVIRAVLPTDQTGINTFLDKSGSGTINALNGAVTATVNGCSTINFQVTGTFTLVLSPEATADGTNWTAIEAIQVQSSPIILPSLNSPGLFMIPCGGFQQVRFRCSTYTSGTATVAWNAGAGVSSVQVFNATASALNAQVVGTTAAGSAISGNPVQVGGTDGTNVRELPINAKNTQSTYAVSTQDQKDTGRNISNLFMAAQVVSTNTETLQSLTGYKSGAAVGATTTPAVVTTGKTYRIQKITITYVAITTAGTIQVNMRANLSGVVALGSPLVDSWSIGAASATAGISQAMVIEIPDGLEFAGGTGIGITIQGIGATGTAAAVGYGKVSISGYEY